jgi:hypothetical protein
VSPHSRNSSSALSVCGRGPRFRQESLDSQSDLLSERDNNQLTVPLRVSCGANTSQSTAAPAGGRVFGSRALSGLSRMKHGGRTTGGARNTGVSILLTKKARSAASELATARLVRQVLVLAARRAASLSLVETFFRRLCRLKRVPREERSSDAVRRRGPRQQSRCFQLNKSTESIARVA